MVQCVCCKEKEADAKYTCDCSKKAKYCSTDCKIIAARKHEACIAPGSLRSSDYLLIAVYEDLLPSHKETIKDYGFANCTSSSEWTSLFSLYVGLIKLLQLPIDVLHEYCMKDAIADIVKQTYETHPEESWGCYYPWFLQHQYIVKNGNKVDLPQL